MGGLIICLARASPSRKPPRCPPGRRAAALAGRMTALVVRAQGVVFGRFCGEVSESHSTPSVFDIWVRPTEAPGGAEEAHRRWPEGRSEQGSSKAKADPDEFEFHGFFSLGWEVCDSSWITNFVTYINQFAK